MQSIQVALKLSFIVCFRFYILSFVELTHHLSSTSNYQHPWRLLKTFTLYEVPVPPDLYASHL